MKTFPGQMQTRHYRSLGEGPESFWLPPEGSGENPPLPPAPQLICAKPVRELFVRGMPRAFELLRQLPEFGFAVVGTRKPQIRSIQLVQSRLASLKGTQLIVLSGLALGVDAAAHRAALDSGLPTIAILGSSVEEIYPPENRDLADRILKQGGLLVSEFEAGKKIEKHFFLLRNRLIAGWSKATWIVEAAYRSGALNTANWAWNHDRETYATPSFPGDPAHAGNQKLIITKKAHPFWEPNCLKNTWPDLKTLNHPLRIHPLPPLWKSAMYNDRPPITDAEHLRIQTSRLTIQQGGASVENLLEWSLAQGWDPQRYFDALQVCLSERRIEDREGVLHTVQNMNT